jgi:hypothetical protein
MPETQQVLTAKRPCVPKVSPPAEVDHHKFEDYLASPYLQKLLKLSDAA